ncbi:hypothetical protein BC830DRAFT_904741 [Chytriomyces sp. MP71]|nr:hypothetical protein BC830DRAFT_904741 [Chytriomyces sp. MP71]
MVSPETLQKVFRHASIAQLTIQLPMMILFKPICESIGIRFLEAPFPSWSLMALQLLCFMVAEDHTTTGATARFTGDRSTSTFTSSTTSTGPYIRCLAGSTV